MVADRPYTEHVLRIVGLLGVAWLTTVSPAEAHRSASSQGKLHRERYLACSRADAAQRVDCVGPRLARRAMIQALAVGDLVKGKNLAYWIDPARRNAIWAAYFAVKEAIPALRTWLDVHLAPGDRDDSLFLDKQGLRGEAAFALARLGDRASTDRLEALLRELETDGYGSLWTDTLTAFAELDPARASRYAIDFLARQTDLTTSLPGGSSKLVALDLILEADGSRALPVLTKATKHARGDHAYCEIMGMRTRFDPALRAKTRSLFEQPYGGSWLAGCAESVLRRWGDQAGDAATILRHLGRDDLGMDHSVATIAYVRLLELVATLRTRSDAASRDARAFLRKGLEARASYPNVADPTHVSFAPHYVVLHTAALAGLGDDAARKRLAAMVLDPKGTRGPAWLAALHDLRLRLPGSVDRVALMMARAVADSNALQGDVYDDIRTRVLEAFLAVAPTDGRWAVMMLDTVRRDDVAELALHHVARHQPKGACEAVTAAARGTSVAAAELAFLGLTSLGTTCLPALEALATARDASKEVRGTAIEFVAVLESPRLCEILRAGYRDDVWAAALERAVDLRKPNCSGPRK